MVFLRSKTFWTAFVTTAVVVGTFFAWELHLLPEAIPAPVRAYPETWEMLFALTLGFLLSLNVGLFRWRKKEGSCPVGAKRATKIAGAIGATVLLCPACILIPVSLLGISFSLVFLSPFLPLLRIIALLLLAFSTKMLWPETK